MGLLFFGLVENEKSQGGDAAYSQRTNRDNSKTSHSFDKDFIFGGITDPI